MNYIKRLEHENAQKAAMICMYAAVIQDLREYLALPKFHNDTTVQVQDILSRLQDYEHYYRTLLEV